MRPVIVGGGPAGAAAAIVLARHGVRPLLLERDRQVAEKVCGEFLAADAAGLLARLGVDLAALGAAPIGRAILAAGAWRSAMRLPFAGWSLPRATLDTALLDAAMAAGAEVVFGARVREGTRHGGLWRLSIAGGEAVETPTLVLATGKHDLRGLQRTGRDHAIGVKLPMSGSPPEAAIALLACRGGYAGLQPRAGGGANLCAALDPRAPGVAEAARSPEGFIAHVADGSRFARQALAGLAPALNRPMTVAGIPYGHVEASAGMYRVGDQAAVIPSLCGDGVAIALASGMTAARAILAQQPPAGYHATLLRGIGRGMRLAGLVSMVEDRAPGMLVAGVAIAPWLAAWTARRTRLGDSLCGPGARPGDGV